MASWDRCSPSKLAARREVAVRTQVVDWIGPFSPFWRARLAVLGRTARQVASLSALERLPAVGERDVCPDGDPAGAAALVLQAGERGYALHAEGPELRRALLRRVVSHDDYRALVEAETRPTSYVYAGQALRFPVASTRSDLDLVARVGARLWKVLGLRRADVVASALRGDATALVTGLSLAALGAGSPMLAPGDHFEDLLDTLRVAEPTVLVVPATGGAALLRRLAGAGAAVSSLKTVLVAGPPNEQERVEIDEALTSRLRSQALTLAVHVPDGHRLIWGECRESAGRTGLHTYPDLELVDLVDPETGEYSEDEGPGEVVVTQLGFRGSALLRWRTGDLAGYVDERPCPSCRRTVPRVVELRGGALVPELALRTGLRPVDLRAVASALSGRPDVSDWRVVLASSGRDGSEEFLVHVLPPPQEAPADVAVSVTRDLRMATGLLPSQVIVSTDQSLPFGEGLSPRLLIAP